VHASCVKSGVCTCVQTLCRPRVLLKLSKNEKTSNQALAETTGIEDQNLLKTQKLTLTEKRKQFKENFIEQTNLRWNLSYKLQTTKTRMSSRKPLRRITSDRGEDDCLSKRNFLKSYMRLTLPQLACTRGLCEGRGMGTRVQTLYRPRVPLWVP
jgi:hypothetical protein